MELSTPVVKYSGHLFQTTHLQLLSICSVENRCYFQCQHRTAPSNLKPCLILLLGSHRYETDTIRIGRCVFCGERSLLWISFSVAERTKLFCIIWSLIRFRQQHRFLIFLMSSHCPHRAAVFFLLNHMGYPSFISNCRSCYSTPVGLPLNH